MYDRAYQICEDKELLKPYLYASYKYMSLEEFHILLTKHSEYQEVNAQMRSEMDEVKQNLQIEPMKYFWRSGRGNIEEIIHNTDFLCSCSQNL